MKRQHDPPPARKRVRTRKLIPVYEKSWTVTCAWCGAEFAARRSDARYCSGRCRSAAFRQRAKDRAHLVKLQESERLFGADVIQAQPSVNAWKAFPWSTAK